MTPRKFSFLYFLVFAVLLLVACSPSTEPADTSPSVQKEQATQSPQSDALAGVTPGNVIASFEKELNRLNQSQLSSLDEGRDLFQQYRKKARDASQVDSLFFPSYWMLYNQIGRRYLIGKTDEEIDSYGFQREFTDRGEVVYPVNKPYLTEQFIPHLSVSMQEFLSQQLAEFEQAKTLEEIAKNALWWEGFKSKYPNFMLGEMVDFHYEKWHLRRLLSGTKELLVFDKNKKLLPEVKSLYNKIIKDNPNTGTAKQLKDYLSLLAKKQDQKSEAVEVFLKQFAPE